jgi:hypothetical protein
LIVFERQTGRVLAAAPGAETTLGPPGPARDARLVAAAAAPDDGADFTLSVFEIGDDALCGALIRSQETDEALGRGMLLAELSPLVAHELSQPIATVMNWGGGPAAATRSTGRAGGGADFAAAGRRGHPGAGVDGPASCCRPGGAICATSPSPRSTVPSLPCWSARPVTCARRDPI